MRQLTAIMFADIMGYTAMMQENEMHAMRSREKFRKALDREIMAHHGRIIQYNGDGALCSFNSAIDAVRSAMAIQKDMRDDPQVPLRIGIHSGDVMVDEKNIYGDGVNIASRIESFAVAGGIFISAKVYDEIKNQNNIEAVSLGTFELKNVKLPLEIYAVSNAGLIVPSKEKLEGKGKKVSDLSHYSKRNSRRTIILSSLMALVILTGGYLLYQNFFHRKNNITDKSIAVLPFENLSDNKEDEYFTEGMTDEILTELSKMSGLKVLSRTSTAQYKGTTKTMKQIGAELGVQSLVEGSVRKVGDQLRVIVQLINAKTDEHIWAKTYNREVKDVFEIQSAIALQIASELDNKLTTEEKKRIGEKPTDNMLAYDYYLRGKSYAGKFWSEGDMQYVPFANRMFREAFKLDPKFVDPYAYLIALYIDVYYYHIAAESDSYLPLAKGLLDTLLALNIDKAIVHVALGSYRYKIDGDYNSALAEFGKAIEEDPNNTEAPLLRSEVHKRQGKMSEALEDIQKVLDRNPNEVWHLAALFETYLFMRNAEAALACTDKLISLAPDEAVNYKYKALTIAALQGDLLKADSVLSAAEPMFEADKFAEMHSVLEVLGGNYSTHLHDLF
ncbi:MAG TPA: adenylate/guanylate cyclase domain-containing protein [Chitinophagales bacterium]|nr:adenylate/guanylate cyclase domain-containing protein [Chitinophagales bacterium]